MWIEPDLRLKQTLHNQKVIIAAGLTEIQQVSKDTEIVEVQVIGRILK